MRRLSAATCSLSVLVFIFTFIAMAFSQLESRNVPVTGLHEPSGEFGIGRTAFEWVDHSRPADNAAEAAAPYEPAELMIYVWYPTEPTRGNVRGALFPGAREIDSAPDTMPGFKSGPLFGGNWSLVVSGDISSHAQEGKPIAKSGKRFPVVIFSPAAFGTCFEYTSAIEDLVSHGYIVVSIEHTYETFAVRFPDGRVRTLPIKAIQERYLAGRDASQEESYDKFSAWSRRRVGVRAADMSFVLDKLAELNATPQFAARLDVENIAAMGHSRGGWAAILACQKDRRFRACVNLDGSNDGEGLDYPGAPAPIQPILYVEIAKTLELPNDWVPLKRSGLTAAKWVQKWHEQVEKRFNSFPGGGYFVQLGDTNLDHYSFSDRNVLRAEKEHSREREQVAVKGLRLTQFITRSFLDRYLKNKNHSVLRDLPEVTVRKFGRG